MPGKGRSVGGDHLWPYDDAGTRSAALLVLMATLESSSHPKAFANAVKHFAFTRCGELDLYGMVDAQVAVIEAELLRDLSVVS